MWPFKAQADVSKLSEELENVKRQVKGLKFDLDDLYDRFSRLSGKIAKRDQREQNEAPQEPSAGEEIAPTSVGLSPTFSRLSPHQRRIQQQILARRVNGGQ